MKTNNKPGTLKRAGVSPSKDNIGWKRILVPVDFSESSIKALDYAMPLARRTGGKLLLMHVVQFPSLPMPAVTGGAIGDVRQAHKALTQQARERLKTLARQTGAVGLIAHKLVTAGTAWDQIVKAARRLNCDLVVFSIHAGTGLRRMLSSHTAEHVVRMTSCPVLCVKG